MPEPYFFQIGVTASPPPPSRQVEGYTYSTTKFVAQSTKISKSWGLQPAFATIKYVGLGSPLTVGQILKITCGGHTFWGICQSDMPEVSTAGATRLLQFVDMRELLDWDDVYCCFNKLDIVTISGVRYRRYEHIYPADWESGIKTYTNSPLSAADIIAALISAPTVQTAWVIKYVSGGSYLSGYHGALANPAYDIDCMSGKSLGQAILEVCDQHGVTFASGDGINDLVFTRKGEGTIPANPELSDDRKAGEIVSKNPTRLRVVGAPNLYQVHNIPMTPDWAPGWESFFDFNKLQDFIFNNLTTEAAFAGVPAGTPYDSVVGDVEHTIGRQLASARAYQITVREFANIRQSGFGDGALFIDYRKFTGKPRNDMPAALYIRTILFRAFKLPNGFFIVNSKGRNVPLDSLEIVSEMIAQVTHDPLTGVMSWDTALPSDGPGYAIVQGYQVGQDGFRTINPARFNLSEWTSSLDVWQHIGFQIDDSGGIDKFIIFDEPVIDSSTLFTADTAELNGFGALVSNPTFSVPAVECALTFRAEKFNATFGAGGRDKTVMQAQLYDEYLGGPTGGWVMNPYSDGQTAYQKAQTLANSMLTLQFKYAQGGFKRILKPDNDGIFPAGTKITGVVDRVTLSAGTDGMIEEVDFTSERMPKSFVASRDFDRRERDRGLFPGQKEMTEKSNQLKMVASSLRARPDIMKSMAEALHGRLRDVVLDKSKVPVAGIKAYTPIKKLPTAYAGTGKPTNTVGAVFGDSTHKVFVGISVGHLEDGGIVRVRDSGDFPARVKGPVVVDDSLALSNDIAADYLVKGSAPFAGKALQEITGTDVRVIMVRLGSGGGGEGAPVWLP